MPTCKLSNYSLSTHIYHRVILDSCQILSVGLVSKKESLIILRGSLCMNKHNMYYQTFGTKFSLPRPVIPKEMIDILEKEIERQKVDVAKANKKQLLELKKICDEIEKDGISSHLVCAKLPERLGYGIFLHPDAKPIPKGHLIGSYSGIVSFFPQNEPGDSVYSFAPIFDIRLPKEKQKLYSPRKRFHPRRLYSMDVDAEKSGNFIRFVNHSDQPNLVSYLFKIPKNSYGLLPSPIEVIYLSSKTIRPGEQLLISYEGDDGTYWKYLKIKPTPITPETYQLNRDLLVKKI